MCYQVKYVWALQCTVTYNRKDIIDFDLLEICRNKLYNKLCLSILTISILMIHIYDLVKKALTREMILCK